LFSQGQGEGLILKIAYFLEKYIEADDWQCHYAGGRCCDACPKQGENKCLMWN